MLYNDVGGSFFSNFVIQRSFSDEESRVHKVDVTEILRFTSLRSE